MAICAEQSKVALVGFPILMPVPPCGGLSFELGRWVDVVNVQCPNIRIAALNAPASQRLDQRKLLGPVSRMLVNGGAILVPERFLAIWRAISPATWLATLLAHIVAGPPRGQIARLSAIFSGAFSDAARMHFCRLAAVRAGNRDGALSHVKTVSQYIGKYEPKYFDIACRRISEALKQPDLFIEKPAPAKQEAMF